MVGTPSPQTISTKQLELAQRAERYPHEALSTLAHFIDLDWLREAYRRTRKDGAPGVQIGSLPCTAREACIYPKG
jgi:hypothetical protein